MGWAGASRPVMSSSMRRERVRPRFLAGFLLGLGLAGCDTEPRLARLASDATILAFGDSLTYGTGVNPEQSYPALLQRLTGRRGINAGIPGEVSAEGLARLPELLDRHRPGLLLLCHGANDILRGLDQRQAAANVRAMVELARARAVAVLLIAVPRFGVWLAPADWYFEVAAQAGVLLEADVISQILRSPRLKSDPVHPNAEGYQRLAEAVVKKLREARAL